MLIIHALAHNNVLCKTMEDHIEALHVNVLQVLYMETGVNAYKVKLLQSLIICF